MAHPGGREFIAALKAAFPARSVGSLLRDLAFVIERGRELKIVNEFDDIIITCELCQTEQYWHDNFGDAWAVARWWYCGPFGLDCPGIG